MSALQMRLTRRLVEEQELPKAYKWLGPHLRSATVFYWRRGVLQLLNLFVGEIRTTKVGQTPMITGDS